MPYFPLFVDLSRFDVLVVGAGRVAGRKLAGLLRFAPGRLKVVAPEVCSRIRAWQDRYGFELAERCYRPGDLTGRDLVIVAVDDEALQEQISQECRHRRILCNSAGGAEQSSFAFPALVTRGEVVLGIGSSGQAPSLSAALRRELEALLPGDLHRLCDELAAERRRRAPGAERRNALRQQTTLDLAGGRPC